MSKKRSQKYKDGSANRNTVTAQKNGKSTLWKTIKFALLLVSVICIIVALISLIKTAVNLSEEKNFVDKSEDGIYTIYIDVKKFGTMTLEIDKNIAPITVDNFLSYVKKGFYDGLTFHRIMDGFMIQGGSSTGDGSTDTSLKPIKGEFSSNGWKNDLLHTKGVISMARTNDPNSATSQFFICLDKAESLDGKYAAFGRVVHGFDVLEKIGNVDVTMDSSGELSVPVKPVVIDSIRLPGDVSSIYETVIPCASVAVIAMLAYFIISLKMKRKKA